MVDIPFLLPSGWQSFFCGREVDKFVKDTVVEATDIFFDKLTSDSPSQAEFQIASDAVQNKLSEVIESNYWIDMFCGEDATSEQRGYLRLHLRKLVPLPVIPDLVSVQSEVRFLVLVLVTVITTVVGLFFGGGIAQFFGVVDDVGFMFGAVVGVIAGIFSVTILATRERLRNKFLLGLGLVAGADFAIFWLRNMFLVLRGSPLLIIKRFIFYAGLMLIALAAKRKRIFNRENCRKEVEAIIGQWCNSVIAIFAVLTYKINSLEQNPFNRYMQDGEKLNVVVSIVKKLQKAEPKDTNIIIRELVQELEACGFEISNEADGDNFCNDNYKLTTNKKFIWEESQNKFYNPIGIIRNGDKFQIIEEPVIRNEIIERKGIIKKK
ncbi:MAG: hypothetical protein LBP59_11505 [Planctomycetaceae bacterium]|jgi:hypothetical protein|nr:hypothetical protein [Planctomycetaceae bacterium]